MGFRRGIVLLLGVSSCGPVDPHASLRLLEFRQQDFDSVALNEELVFYFSEDLDRSSVTTDSVRIMDENGREVAGERTVRGNALLFRANLPLAPNLSDGGLRPAQRYQVCLGGFPRIDGLRATSGAVLSASLQLSFATAAVGGSVPLFLDPFLGPFHLRPRGKPSPSVNAVVLEDGRLVLEYGEALDPSKVPAARDDFVLKHYPPGARELEVLPTVPRLIANRRNHAELLLELTGPEGIGSDRLPPDSYFLSMPGRELRTLGGRTVEPGWPVLTVIVPKHRVARDLSKEKAVADLPAPGCTGTAHWEAGKGLRLRLPAAAGSGADGAVVLRALPARADTHATRLVVEGDGVVDLSGHRGPLVLRSQTSIEVRGRLTRRGAGAHDDPLTREFNRAEKRESAGWTPLSAWVKALLDPDEQWKEQPWTVLIAGGDLIVPQGGAIEVEGPLVLVAGGGIRVSGVARTEGDLWHSAESGAAAHGRNRPLPLLLDEPLVNPLRTRLIVGALTEPFDWTASPGRWRTIVIGRAGGGNLSVSYLQAPHEGPERAFVDPNELESGTARAILLLEMSPGQGEPFVAPEIERLVLETVPGP